MTATKEDIRDFLKECWEELEAEGAPSAVGLMHFQGNGSEVEISSFGVNHKAFNDFDKMADLLDSHSTRHARGISNGGVQQFQIGVI